MNACVAFITGKSTVARRGGPCRVEAEQVGGCESSEQDGLPVTFDGQCQPKKSREVINICAPIRKVICEIDSFSSDFGLSEQKQVPESQDSIASLTRRSSPLLMEDVPVPICHGRPQYTFAGQRHCPEGHTVAFRRSSGGALNQEVK